MVLSRERILEQIEPNTDARRGDAVHDSSSLLFIDPSEPSYLKVDRICSPSICLYSCSFFGRSDCTIKQLMRYVCFIHFATEIYLNLLALFYQNVFRHKSIICPLVLRVWNKVR